MKPFHKRNMSGLTLLSALFIIAVPACWETAQGQGNAAVNSLPAPSNAEARFTVAHVHTASQCIGYLYVSGSRIRYEVAQPETDKKTLSTWLERTSLQVQQWTLLGVHRMRRDQDSPWQLSFLVASRWRGPAKHLAPAMECPQRSRGVALDRRPARPARSCKRAQFHNTHT